jgi:hypothetical protein
MSENKKNYEICGAKTRAGTPCKKPAGWGTNHKGIGKCKLHGGATPIKHGLYSKYTNHRLGDMIDKLSDDDELLNLRKTIALQQSLIIDILNKVEDESLTLTPRLSKTLSDIGDKLGKNIERRQKVEEGEKYILQIEEVQNVVNQVVVIVQEEVKDPAIIDKVGTRLKELSF